MGSFRSEAMLAMNRGLCLVLLIAAWSANVEALPVQGDTVQLGAGAEVEAPVGGQVAADEAAVKEAEKEVAADASASAVKPIEMGSSASIGTKPVDTNAIASGMRITTPETRDFTAVRTPAIDPNEHLYVEPTYKKPPPQEHINRNLKPGDPMYPRQQAETPIFTYNHQMHHIHTSLQAGRDHAYATARGANNVLLAAEDGSKATADMAYRARAEQEENLAVSEAKIDKIKLEIADVSGEDNKEHAKLQLALERAKRQHAKQLAEANTMGAAVDKMIAKAGAIEGNARAAFDQLKDPTMELEGAIVAAAKAKMALEAHDRQVARDNARDAADAKNKAVFEAADAKGQAAVEAIKEHEQKLNAEAKEKDFQIAAKDAAAATKRISDGLGVAKPLSAKEKEAAETVAAEANTPTPAEAKAAADKKAADKKAADEKAATEKKAADDKLAADQKAVADAKAAADKAAPAAEKPAAAAEKPAAEKPAAAPEEKPAAEKPAAP